MSQTGGKALRTFKSVFDVAKALLPVLYCGGLLYYFLGVGGSVQGIKDIGLGPTVLGLAAVGVLFCIPLALKIARLFRGPRLGSGGGAPKDKDNDDDDGGAAADAAIARYMAWKSTEAATGASTPAPRPVSGGPARRQGFGRKPG
jgi:hypothetical protein